MSTIREIIDSASRYHSAGQFAAAEACYRRLLSAFPEWADLHNNLGSALQGQGKFEQAEEAYTRAFQMDSNHAVARCNLGVLLQRRGELEAAAAHYEAAVELHSGYADAHCNLGSILLERGLAADAVDKFKLAISLQPGFAAAHNNLGNALKAIGQSAEALECYHRAIALQPAYAEAHNNLGCALFDLRKLPEATTAYQSAIRHKPDYAEAHCNLGLALKESGQLEPAVVCLKTAIKLDPKYAEAYNILAGILKDDGQLTEAEALCENALKLAPDFPAALCTRGSMLQDRGRLIEAENAFKRALELKPGYPEALYSLSLLKRCQFGDPIFSVTDESLKRLPETKRPYIHFGRAKALEDLGDYKQSFGDLLAGNKLKRKFVSYDQDSIRSRFAAIASIFNPTTMNRFRDVGDRSSVPIFILGMPRSGSTMIEQILCSHRQVQGAGELRLLSIVASDRGDFPCSFPSLDADRIRCMAADYLDGLPPLQPGRSRITDKMPGNFEYVGLIHLMFPNARIIHSVRDPMDTCFSCFSKLFASGAAYSYELRELGRFYRMYQQLMTHWRSVLPAGVMVDASYEALVDDLPAEARRLVAHCGLDWDDQCLAFHENDRAVSTASNVQVREPLYRSSINRWRRYEAHLQPLLEELGL
jgi:tetratricopeptide (TPR) repeat protein